MVEEEPFGYRSGLQAPYLRAPGSQSAKELLQPPYEIGRAKFEQMMQED